MRLVFLESNNKKNDLYFLSKEDSHHIIVNRFKIGESITATLGEFLGEFVIKKIENKIVWGNFIIKDKIKRPEHNLSLILGLPKDKALIPIIQKSSEIGVNNIYLIPVNFSDRKTLSENNIERLYRISKEACMQSGNYFLPKIVFNSKLKEFLSHNLIKESLNFLADETSSSDNNLFTIINKLPIERFKNINIFIGPEGGISDDERKILMDSNFYPVNLGPFILRTETAAIVLTFFLKLFQNTNFK